MSMIQESANGDLPTIGFAGLGRMGSIIAANLLEKGYQLSVYNRSPGKCEPLVAAGARLATTPADLAHEAEVLVVMVSDGLALRSLLERSDGLLAGATQGTLLIVMSTIGVTEARECAALCAERGVAMVDAPVSGSTITAEAGQLTVLMGGDDPAVERATPIVAATSKAQFNLGPSGSGAAMKIALNVMIPTTALAISEALLLAERSGIDRDTAYDVIANSAVASPFVGYKREGFIRPDETPVAVRLETIAKDIDLARHLGDDVDALLPGVEAANVAVRLTIEQVGSSEDLVQIATMLRSQTTMPPGSELSPHQDPPTDDPRKGDR
jgi:3-hydroxyisobutyrate dehydrogenase-like beta-hydroxyacid dehydrogenase